MTTRPAIMPFDWFRLDKLSRDLILTDTPTVKAVLKYLAIRAEDAERVRAAQMLVNCANGRQDIRYTLGYEEGIQDDARHLSDFIEQPQHQPMG